MTPTQLLEDPVSTATSNDASLLTAWLRDTMESHNANTCTVAFSGGVDSAVVAKAAVLALNSHVRAVCVRSASSKRGSDAETVRLAGEIRIPLVWVDGTEFFDDAYTANTTQRCYHCKRIRMGQILDYAQSHGAALVVDGSNADDEGDFRPGRRANEELGILSPLRDLGLTKDRVRELARYWRLSIHDKPAEPCLSTRIAYGWELTPQRLTRIDKAEEFLHSLGFTPVRARFHADDHLRIEVAPEKLEALLALREPIIAQMRNLGFRFVAIDLEGYRSGKMNPPEVMDEKAG